MDLSKTDSKPDMERVDESTTELILDPKAEKALVRRIDTLLMPALWLMYLFSYADRTKYACPLACPSKASPGAITDIATQCRQRIRRRHEDGP